MDPKATPHERSPAEPGRTPVRRGRILFTLLAVLAFTGLVPLATVAWKLIDISRESLVTQQQEHQLLMAASIARELEIHIEGLRAQLLRVAQTLGGSMRVAGADGQHELRRSLDDVLDGRMPYLRYTYFTAEARRTVATGVLPERLDPLFQAGLEEAAAVLSQHAQTRAETTILSEPILLGGRPPRAGMVISAPVVSGGRFRGVLSALVDVDAVWQAVVGRHRYGHALFVLDHSGRVLASQDPTVLRPGSDLSHSPLVARFVATRGLAKETMPFREVEDGVEREYIGSYEVLDLDPQDWGVFVQARLEEVYAPVQRMIESVLAWALVALGIAVVAALVFADTISRPIKRLALASRAFASGDFSTRAPIRSRNEIGELGHAFNRMATDIEDYIQRLRRAAEENRELFLGTIRTMAQAIDAKDPYTRGHSVRVNRYSVAIGRQLGLGEAEIGDLHVSSLMHDVGKIGIHDHILQKPGKLTADEFEVMKTHTVLGAQILAPIRQMQRVIPGLRSHHERWGGGGYPDGLKGAEIPEMARIIAVADSFDAMTTHRPYQRAMTVPQAVERLNALKGVAFDERIVEAFNRAIRHGQIVADAGQLRVDEPAAAAATTAAAR